MDSTMFIIRGVTRDGKEVFYTGKTGETWVSMSRSASFGYVSQQVARNRALGFNRMTGIHGIHFIVIAWDRSDVIELADGYNGHTMPFFTEPIAIDGDLVKLRCAIPNKEYLTVWKHRAVLA